ncbi:MAG: hypothetical protein NTX39_10390 [Opitutae bacterium]|nr:hypothetical protein [Opitutae bacterium]
MNHTKFVVSRFENRNGLCSWRVSGFLHGVRLRKNFKTREEAAAEKAALEIKALQSTSGLRSIATALTEERVEVESDYAEMQEFFTVPPPAFDELWDRLRVVETRINAVAK